MRQWFNWLLVGGGGLLIVAEMLLGAATGFDLALLGISLSAGGVLGLVFSSTKVGIFSAGALALVYLVFFRRWVKSKISAPHVRTNVDALVGRQGLVTERISAHEAGKVKLGDEVWRAALAAGASEAREPGQAVTVEAVEGVTLKVK